MIRRNLTDNEKHRVKKLNLSACKFAAFGIYCTANKESNYCIIKINSGLNYG